MDAVRDYAAAVLGCRRDDVSTVRRFDEGNRHDVYGVGAAGRDLVVRVSRSDDDAERQRVHREALVLERLAGAGAPRLVDVRMSNPWFAAPVLSTTFVAGSSIEIASVTAAGIERLGAVVASVHDHSVDDLADHLGGAGTILAYAEQRLEHVLDGLRWARDPLPVHLRARLRRAADHIHRSWSGRRRAREFRADEGLALLHGDIAGGNVLWGTDPVLIDWEYVRLGDPADEIAYLFDQNGLAPPQRDSFWRGYRAGDDTIERVTWWEPLTLLGSTLWWAERFVRRIEAGPSDPEVPRPAPYYLERTSNRAERLGHLLGAD